MRMLAGFAILAVTLTGITGAGAADLHLSPRGQGTAYSADAVRAAPVVIYDDQPGVAMRAYWLPPARNHHYFPFGRYLRSPRPTATGYVRPRPAQSYQCTWSTVFPDGAARCSTGGR